MVVVVLFTLVFALSYVNGANDNIKPFATVYGSDVCPYPTALRWATGAQVFGSIASIFVAGALIKAFSGKGVVPVEVLSDDAFLVAIAGGAVIAVGLATRLGFPISTTHSLLGGLLGAGLALSPGQLQWGVLLAVFALPLVMSPLISMTATAVLYPIAAITRRRFSVEPDSEVVLPGDMPDLANAAAALDMQYSALATADGGEVAGAEEDVSLRVTAARLTNTLHLASACSLAFARGLNDTPKILGLVAAAWLLEGWSGTLALVAVAATMALGGWMHSRALADTLGKRITPINHGQGLIANSVSSILVIGASLLGLPVSTTHVSTGSIFGIGAWTGARADWRLVGQIVLAWVVTLPVAMTGAYVLARIASF